MLKFPFTFGLGQRASLAAISIIETNYVLNIYGHRTGLKESQDALQSCDPAETVGCQYKDLFQP